MEDNNKKQGDHKSFFGCLINSILGSENIESAEKSYENNCKGGVFKSKEEKQKKLKEKQKEQQLNDLLEDIKNSITFGNDEQEDEFTK